LAGGASFVVMGQGNTEDRVGATMRTGLWGKKKPVREAGRGWRKWSVCRLEGRVYGWINSGSVGREGAIEEVFMAMEVLWRRFVG